MLRRKDPRKELRKRISAAPVQDPPDGWTRITVAAVGGLAAIGLDAAERFVLVQGSQGRGVFELATGSRVARARGVLGDGLDPHRLTCVGIGPLEGEAISICGLWGGGLARSAADGWSVECIALDWPGKERLIVCPPGSGIHQPETAIVQLEDPVTRVHAFGFTPSGRYLLLATGSDLTIYGRGAATEVGEGGLRMRPAPLAAWSFLEITRELVGRELTGIIGLWSAEGWEPDWPIGLCFAGEVGLAASTHGWDDWFFSPDPDPAATGSVGAGCAWRSVAEPLGLAELLGRRLERVEVRWGARIPELPEADFVLVFPGAELVLFNAADELGVRMVRDDP